MFEANVWGSMFYCAKIADSDNPANTFGIHLYSFVGTTMLFIRHAETMLRELGDSGPIHIQMRLSAIREVPWLHGSIGINVKQGSSLDDQVELSISTSSELLREKTDGVVIELLRHAFLSVNWPDLIDTRSKLEDLLRSGYQYNSWYVPESWQV
jgi:hypothetical protein